MSQTSLDTLLSRIGIEALNEMQLAAVESINKEASVILLSPTGSGKTLAFLLPLLPLLEADPKKTSGLVIAPSRELALQIENVFRSLGTGLKVTCCYGGHKREIEENNLVQAPSLIVGTPGRLADHIRRGNIQTASIKAVVLDEFDKSLESGFHEEVAFVLASLPAVQKRVLTSATEAVEIPHFAGVEGAARLNFLPEDGTPAPSLEVRTLTSPDKDKIDTLFGLLCFTGIRSSVVFCNHRESVERVSALLSEKGITNTFYHGAMEQRDREVALAKFRNGSSSVLVTTDLAARGLDVPNIRYIIHYHLPLTEDVYTHRNGRTARMDATGTAVLLVGPDEKLLPFITTAGEMELPQDRSLPEKPKWTTLFVGAGKKDKVNKVDIVGFLSNRGGLKSEDIGLIEVKDFFSFVAVRKTRVGPALQAIKDQKLKNKKIKIDVAK